jgi:hypothetical protein
MVCVIGSFTAAPKRIRRARLEKVKAGEDYMLERYMDIIRLASSYL